MEDHITRFLLFLNEDRKLAANTVAAYQNDLRQLQEYLRSRDHGNGHTTNEQPAVTVISSEMLDAVTRPFDRALSPQLNLTILSRFLLGLWYIR